MYTMRSLRAIDSHSGRAALPPNALVPRQFQTPSRATQQRLAETAASPLRTPSVIQSGIAGSVSWSRTTGWTSRTIRAPATVSYLTARPRGSIRGVSGRAW